MTDRQPETKEKAYCDDCQADRRWTHGNTYRSTVRLCPKHARAFPSESDKKLLERVAQLTAHRACCNEEHDPANGKIAGFCVVCGVPWPCDVAKDERIK